MSAADDTDSLLSALDPEQRAVATHEDGPLIVMAGAGTGKTRAITHRIAYRSLTGLAEASRTLALTFTAKAAGEMRSRLRGLGVPHVQARTFHSAALRQLRFFWPAFAEGPFPELMSQKAGAVARALAQCGFEVERETVRDIAAEIEFAAVSLLGVDEYVERSGSRDLPAGFRAVDIARVMQAYSELKTQRRILDFEDVLTTLSGVLASRPDIAAKVYDQYRHFVVDEFQDVSALQYDLLGRWLGSRTDLCVVGDPAQTIYTFAGASDSYLQNLHRELPEARTVSLVRNYRSTPPIVESANRVLSHTGRNAMSLRPVRTGGDTPGFTEYGDDQTEAGGVSAAVAALADTGVPLSDIAILFRTNGQSRAYEEALAARSISYVVRGGERFFARREVKEAMALMRASASQRRSGPLDDVVAEVLGSIGWQPTAPARSGAARERWESLNALVDLAAEQQEGAELPVPLLTFVAELDDRQEHQFAPTVNGVTLASIHAAKGLEWPHVFLVGMSEGLMPISYAKSAANIAEERRLFYVAVTRARDSLQVTWSQARQKSAVSQRRVSRFVSEMRAESAVRKVDAGQSRRTAAKVCETCGRVLASAVERRLSRCDSCAPAAHAQVLTALQEWRRTEAERLRVPTFMVLTTATMTAIAEKCPRSREQLGQIPGIGPVKIEQFGHALVELVAEVQGRSGLED